MICMYVDSVSWQYRLWSFQERDTKLERVLDKNQHTEKKAQNFKNWSSGGLSKIILEAKVI